MGSVFQHSNSRLDLKSLTSSYNGDCKRRDPLLNVNLIMHLYICRVYSLCLLLPNLIYESINKHVCTEWPAALLFIPIKEAREKPQ